MNVRLEAINLLKKLHRGLKYNYADSELKEKLNERVAKLLKAIKGRDEQIYDLKKVIKESTPKTKAKEAITYNYLEMKTINESLEMLVGEIENTLKNDKVCSVQPLIYKKNLALSIINRNKETMKYEDEGNIY